MWKKFLSTAAVRTNASGGNALATSTVAQNLRVFLENSFEKFSAVIIILN
jgi:hypothetical protein